MSLWSSIGYSGNPYGVAPLRPTAEDSRLLVGRDREIRRLITELRSTDTHPTIEGENGVGKTSLVYVAAYDAMQAHIEGETNQLLIPVEPALQITGDSDEFEQSALHGILSAYLQAATLLQNSGFTVPDLADVERWLNDPVLNGGGGSISALGFGAGATKTASANTGAGFANSGLRTQVSTWLRQTFPTSAHGAFVAIIDNLELLQTSAEARRTLEKLRDGALALPGVRWVLCGAKGIVRSAASSPRMAGRLGSPIELKPVPATDIPELIRRRLAHYSDRPDPETPVDAESFSLLYSVGNENLRNAFKYAQDFAVWLETEDKLQASTDEKRELLESWMSQVADDYEEAANLQPAQWDLLAAIAGAGGSIAPGDHEEFGYNTPQAMRFHLSRLEQANMIDTAVDETDNRRRTISITSIGWLVRRRRAQFEAGH